jgi:thioredoxin-related protein
MHKLLSITLLSLLGLGATLGAAEGWLNDFEAAKEQAAVEGKPMLVDFTGSDWCIWCIKLNDEVFSQAAFKDFAEEKLVLVELDFPRSKAQPAELRAQNEALAGQYGIRGFPTVLVLSPEGELIERTGYRRGGAEDYVAHIEEILASVESGD